MEIKLKVGNDNGNSEHDMYIDKTLVVQPNVNSEVHDLRAVEDQSSKAFMVNLKDNIVATVMSPMVRSGAKTYYIGTSALNSGLGINQLDIDFEEKSESSLPIVNTLGNIAAFAVKRIYDEEKELPEELNIKVDMATSLPIQEYYRDSSKKIKFRENFIKGPHRVNLHVGNQNVHVKIEFEKVLVLAEATPVIFSLIEDEKGEIRHGEIFSEFENEYNLEGVTGETFANKRILHVDIGDGSTEFPVTNGKKPDYNFKNGRSLGVGHAIEAALGFIREELELPDLERQDIPKILKNKDHQYYTKVYNLVYPHLQQQAMKILKEVKQELRKANMEIDVILVYGGGSVLFKEHLYTELKAIAEKTNRAKVLYIPEKYAITMNAVGLSNIVNNKKFFEGLEAKKALQSSENKKSSEQSPVDMLDDNGAVESEEELETVES